MASCYWIKTDYIIKELPCPVILDGANIMYLYQSWMCSEMNPIIWSPFNDKGQFVTDLGFVALAIDFPLRLVLPFVAIAAS